MCATMEDTKFNHFGTSYFLLHNPTDYTKLLITSGIIKFSAFNCTTKTNTEAPSDIYTRLLII